MTPGPCHWLFLPHCSPERLPGADQDSWHGEQLGQRGASPEAVRRPEIQSQRTPEEVGVGWAQGRWHFPLSPAQKVRRTGLGIRGQRGPTTQRLRGLEQFIQPFRTSIFSPGTRHYCYDLQMLYRSGFRVKRLHETALKSGKVRADRAAGRLGSLALAAACAAQFITSPWKKRVTTYVRPVATAEAEEPLLKALLHVRGVCYTCPTRATVSSN